MKYDMIVIGAGSGGLSVGLGLHELGFKVLLIDRSDDNIGGECLNNGCVPSKAFIHVTKLVEQATKAQRFGLEVNGQISLEKIWEYVRDAQSKIRHHENAQYFQNMGLDVVLGTAKFHNKNSVEVNGKVYHGRKITIATGSKPRKLELPGIDQVKYYDNENIWEMPKLPQNMLFVGAGPISLELGQAFARLGSNVTMVEVMPGILINEASEVSDILYQQSLRKGIEFHLNTKVTGFPDANTAILQNKDGEWQAKFDVLVVGIGRYIDTRDLNLEVAGIATDDKGRIVVDDYLRTTNRNVYVVGDAANRPQFSHGAELQATVMIRNFFSPIKKKITYDRFSWVTFTEPEVATFGLSEKQLKEQGKAYEKLVLEFDEDDRAITSDYQYGKLLLYVRKGLFGFSDAKLLGGSMVAPNAGEMFQELVLAHSAGLGIKSLFNKIYSYPTGSRVNKTAVLNKYASSIRPWMTKIMKLVY